MNNIVIGLAGVKTSGKSTVANMINEFTTSLEVALADKLKNTCAEVFCLDRNQFDAQELKEVSFDHPFVLEHDDIVEILGKFNVKMSDEEFNSKYKDIIGMKLDTPRKIAQIVGTEILRATGDEDIHCKSVNLNRNGVTIVSDLRFPNEFTFFNNDKDITFVPLHIQRDLAENLVTKDSHPSETSVFKFTDKCIKIDNNGSFSETESQIKDIVDKFINTKKGNTNVGS